MPSVTLKNIWLSYPVFGSGDLSVSSAVKSLATGGIIRRSGKRSVEVCALQAVNFDARDGDRVGVIGHNGAGKTTILKVLAGIYRPQKGRIRRNGKTAAIINPAVGLQSDLSGYKNIENIGLLSGLSTRDIREKIPDIAEFTELGDFLNLAVSTYSAGMRTRLAFAVATSLHPEILIADENLGTGDANFIRRARTRMETMMSGASILILASHSLETVKRLCNRAILLEHGQLTADGTVDEVVKRYQEEAKRHQTANS